MTKYIVFAGKKQVGKSISAEFMMNYINEEVGMTARIVSFADPIKDFCVKVLGLSNYQVYGNDIEKSKPTKYLWDNMPTDITGWYYDNPSVPNGKTGPMTVREVMQVFGTDIMRKCFDYDIWARVPFRMGGTDFVIVDDCRFPNEADIALANKAILIRIEREAPEDGHESEKALDYYPQENYSYIIQNNHTKEDLYRKLMAIMVHEGITG